MSDWEQYLAKQSRRAKIARRIFYWGIFCVLIGMIIFEGIALMLEPEPEYIPKEYEEGMIYFGTDENSIIITATGTGDAIWLETSAGGITIREVTDDIDVRIIE